MPEYNYDNPILKKEREEIRKPTKYQGPDYDEEYLKQFESMKPGERFTQEQLEEITDKAYFGHLRDRELYDRFNYPGFYDEIRKKPQRDPEEIWRHIERYYGSRNNKNFDWGGAKINFRLLNGEISFYDVGRLNFQLMLREKYEK